eukprot:m51a1_g4616 hypothetical protein (1550) ;mRNA; r:277295-283082
MSLRAASDLVVVYPEAECGIVPLALPPSVSLGSADDKSVVSLVTNCSFRQEKKRTFASTWCGCRSVVPTAAYSSAALGFASTLGDEPLTVVSVVSASLPSLDQLLKGALGSVLPDTPKPFPLTPGGHKTSASTRGLWAVDAVVDRPKVGRTVLAFAECADSAELAALSLSLSSVVVVARDAMNLVQRAAQVLAGWERPMPLLAFPDGDDGARAVLEALGARVFEYTADASDAVRSAMQVAVPFFLRDEGRRPVLMPGARLPWAVERLSAAINTGGAPPSAVMASSLRVRATVSAAAWAQADRLVEGLKEDWKRLSEDTPIPPVHLQYVVRSWSRAIASSLCPPGQTSSAGVSPDPTEIAMRVAVRFREEFEENRQDVQEACERALQDALTAASSDDVSLEEVDRARADLCQRVGHLAPTSYWYISYFEERMHGARKAIEAEMHEEVLSRCPSKSRLLSDDEGRSPRASTDVSTDSDRRVQCDRGNSCGLVHDKMHMDLMLHPHGSNVCENTPFECRLLSSKSHMAEFVHVCPFGPTCKKIGNKEHVKYYVHVGAQCPQGSQCCDYSEAHVQSFFHDDIPLVRGVCSAESWCTNATPKHLKAYSHLPPYFSPCPVANLHIREDRFPHFERNVEKWRISLLKHLGGQFNTSSDTFKEIVEWFENLRPVHMCSAAALVSITKLRAVPSLATLFAVWGSPELVLKFVQLRPEVATAMGDSKSATHSAVKQFLLLYIQQRIIQTSPIRIDALKHKASAGQTAMHLLALNAYQRAVHNKVDSDKLAEAEAGARKMIQDNNRFTVVLEAIHDVITASADLLEGYPVSGYWVDEGNGAEDTVQTTIGPHYGKYGNAQVAIVFHRSLMQHPDFYMLPCGAILYHQQWYCSQPELHLERPWCGEAKPWEEGAKDDFYSAVFHGAVSGWEQAAALEWIARVSVLRSMAATDVRLQHIQELWASSDSHTVIEGHLPGFVPLDYVEKIFVNTDASKTSVPDKVRREIDAIVQRPLYSAVQDTKKSNHAFLQRPLMHFEKATGVCLVIPTGLEESFFPFELPSTPAFRVSFQARGSDVMFVLSSKNSVESPVRRALTMQVHKGTLKGFRGPPSQWERSPAVSECTNFNCGCPVSTFVQYMIFVDNVRELVTLQHWGPSSLCNALTCSFPLDFPCRFLSFSSTCQCSQIWDNVVWMTFSSIPKASEDYFGITAAQVDLLLNWAAIAYLVAALPVMWLLSRPRGLQRSRLWPILHVSCVVNGIAGPAIMSSGSLLSATWFPEHERTTATSIAVLFPSLSLAAAYLIGPLVVHEAADFPKLVYIEAALGVVQFLMVALFLRAGPSRPPSASAAYARQRLEAKSKAAPQPEISERQPLVQAEGELPMIAAVTTEGERPEGSAIDLVTLLKNKSVVITMLSAGLQMGVFTAWGGCLQLTLESTLSETQIGWIGFCMTISAILGGVGLAAFIAGMFYGTMTPMYMELAAELSFPVPEDVSASVISWLSNFGLMASLLVAPRVPTPWFNAGSVALLVIAAALMLPVKEVYLRSDVDDSKAGASPSCQEPL